MAESINITLIKREGDTEIQGQAIAPAENQTAMELPTENVEGGGILALGGKAVIALAIAKGAVKVIGEVVTRLDAVERDSMNRTRELRRMGGSGYSSQLIGERKILFMDRYVGGERVVYNRR